MKNNFYSNLFKAFFIASVFGFSASIVNAENITNSNGSSNVSVTTEGNASVNINSQSNTSSFNSVQKDIDESIRVESNNGDTKSEVIINGKKVYEGDSSNIEVKSNSSTNVVNGKVIGDSETKTTVTTKDGKTTVIVEKNGNTSVVKNNNISATTNLDISVNKKNNKLIIKTGDKTQEIDLLPDQAVKVVLDKNFIDVIKGSEKKQSVDIVNEDDKIIYKIEGVKNTKLFGIIPISFDRIVYISASDGEITEYESPFYSKLINIFANEE